MTLLLAIRDFMEQHGTKILGFVSGTIAAIAGVGGLIPDAHLNLVSQFRHCVLFAYASGAMKFPVCRVLRVSAPGKVARPIVIGNSIKVPANVLARFRTTKGEQNQGMDVHVAPYAFDANLNPEVSALHHVWAKNFPASQVRGRYRSASFLHNDSVQRAHSTVAAGFVSAVVGNRLPYFHTATIAGEWQ